MPRTRPNQDEHLAGYLQALSRAVEVANRMAAEPSEIEVRAALLRSGITPTPEAIEAWYEAFYREVTTTP